MFLVGPCLTLCHDGVLGGWIVGGVGCIGDGLCCGRAVPDHAFHHVSGRAMPDLV